jgi:hypothetical protein
MVRALLDGSKTQTRRAFSTRMIDLMYTAAHAGEVSYFVDNGELAPNDHDYVVDFCPYGQPGDKLWVRETHSFVPDGEEPAGCSAILYAADGQQYGKLRPSIHMPRWASRILLEIVNVRVERLSDCSNEDARAEGVMPLYANRCVEAGHAYNAIPLFRNLWESINGSGSWDANPWVWVIEFRRIEPAAQEAA